MSRLRREAARGADAGGSGGEPPGRRPLARRLLRRLGFTAAGLLLVLTLSLLGAAAWLHTARGERFFRAHLLAAANGALAGRIEVDHLALSGLLRIELDGVRLYAPDDPEPVIAVDHAIVQIRVVELVGRWIDLPMLVLDGPRVRLLHEGGTTNLARALAPRHPSASAGPAHPIRLPNLHVRVPLLQLRRGVFQMDGGLPIALDGLHLDARLTGSLRDLTASVALGTQLHAPIERAATLDVRAHWNGSDIRVDLLALHAGETQATLAAALALDLSSARVNIEDLHAAPGDINAFVPAARLRAPVRIAGAASLARHEEKANLEIGLGAGRVRIEAAANLVPDGSPIDLKTWHLALGATNVDLHRIRDGLPPALLRLDLRAEGRGQPTSPSATANVALNGSGSRYGRLPIDRLFLSGRVLGRTAHVSRLLVHAANADLRASGTAGLDAADLQIEIEAPALDETRSQLAKGIALQLPAMSGAAHFVGHLTGRYANPHIALTVDSPDLRYASTALHGLHARVDMKGLRPIPMGTFALTAHRLRALDKDGTSLSLVGEINGREASVDAHGLFGSKPVELVLRGQRLPHRRGEESWVLSRLQAKFLGLVAAAPHASRVRWGRGRIQVHDLDLDGFFGHIGIDASLSRTGPIDARVRIAQLHLEQLPPLLVPKALHLAGTVQLSLDAHGTARSPVAALSLHVASAGIHRLAQADLDVQAHLTRRRVETVIDARLGGGRLALTANVPLFTSLRELVKKEADLPVDVQLTSEHVPLAALAEALPQLPRVSGLMEGAFALHGSMRQPTVQTRWTLANVSCGEIQALQADLSFAYDGDTIESKIALNDPHGLDTTVTASGELPAADLLRGELRWRTRPVALELAARRIDLGWVQLIGYGPPDLSGLLVGRLTSSGPLGSPTVNATFMGTNVSGAGYQHVDAVVDLESEKEITLTANAHLKGLPLFDLTARADVSPNRLGEMTLAERLAIPFEIKAQIAPTPLEALLPAAAESPGESDLPFQTKLGAQLYAAGTLDAPEMHLHVDLDEARRTGSETGVITTDLDYRHARTALAMLFQSPSAGALRANAVFDADLGGSALLRTGESALRHRTGQQPSALSAGLAETLGRPIKLAVDVENFDLGLVNGFSSTLRNLGGTANLHLYKDGPLAPLANDGSLRIGSMFSGLSGSLDVAGARLVLLGTGSFSDVTLKAAGAYPSVQVTELRGKSGNGSFTGQASFEHTGSRKFKGAVSLDLKDLPIVVDFQTRGFLSMNIRAAGTGGPGRIVIPEIVLSHGHVTIPSQLPKHVQSLGPNPDFELVQEKQIKPKQADKEQSWVIVVDKVTIPDDLVVDAPLGTKLTLGAKLHLVKSPAVESRDNPIALSGEITIVHGVLSLLKPFDVDKGTVTFFPDQLENPHIDVKAHYDGPDVTVRVALTGTVDDLHKEFTSSPPMSENEILYYLATGEQQAQPQQADPATLQTEMADAALSALGAAAIGVVKGAVQKVLPSAINPDVLTVETDVAHSGIGRVRAGKYYLKGKLYVGGQYNPSANPLLNQNTYEGEAQYRISRDNSIRLLIGNEGNDQLDYLYELSFPTAAQKKNGYQK